MRLSKNKYNLFFACVIIIFLIVMIYFNFKEEFMNFYDENDNKIDHLREEKIEQDQAEEFIEQNDCVLELGARYGTVSAVINKKLLNPYNHVVVEPDDDVWDALEKNKIRNDCKFQIVRGIISNKKLSLIKSGYATKQKEDTSSSLPHFTFSQIRNMVDKPFSALVADCEGCIEPFLNENTNILKTLRIIILEEDADISNYDNVKKLLIKNDFEQIRSEFNGLWRSVWVRNTYIPINTKFTKE